MWGHWHSGEGYTHIGQVVTEGTVGGSRWDENTGVPYEEKGPEWAAGGMGNNNEVGLSMRTKDTRGDSV